MKKSVVFCSLLAAAVSAHAESGFYVLGSVGQSRFDEGRVKREIERYVAPDAGETYSASVDKSDTGYKLQLGYQFNDNFAIEGGYVDLGELGYKGRLAGEDDDYTYAGSLKGKREVTGFNLDALLILPVNAGFSIFGKVGVVAAKVKTTLDYSEVDTYQNGDIESGSMKLYSENGTKVKAHFGVGVSYQFAQGLSVRVEAERFNKVGDSDTIEGDVDLYSVGLAYRF